MTFSNRKTNRHLALLCTTCAWALFAAPGQSDAGFFEFTPLGSGTTGSRANAISTDGSTIVGDISGRPAKWVNGLPAQTISAEFGSADAVSADGSVIAGVSGVQALRWVGLSEQVVASFQFDPNGRYPRTVGISADGTKTLWNTYHSTNFVSDYSLMHNAQSNTYISFGANIYTTGLSPDGSVIGYQNSGGTGGILRWNGAAYVDDPAFPWHTYVSVTDFLPDNSLAVGQTYFSGLGFYGFLDDPANVSGGFFSNKFNAPPTGVSHDGRTVVGSGSLGGPGTEAIIWHPQAGDPQSIKALLLADGIDVSAWQLDAATDISGDGATIVGYGRNPQGIQEAWRVQVVPEAPSLTLMSVGVALILVRFIARLRGVDTAHRRGAALAGMS